jgi:hypothetical protein
VSALFPLLALAATLSDEPLLDTARVQDVVAAVQSCSRAVTGKVKVDHALLEGDGWRKDAEQGIWIVRRKPGNAAIITANNGNSAVFPENLMQDACLVRVRLTNRASFKAAADELTRTLGLSPYVFKRKQDKWTWSGPATAIAFEPFDNAPNGTAVAQIVVAPLPKSAWRPTPDASSQNKNQEPR